MRHSLGAKGRSRTARPPSTFGLLVTAVCLILLYPLLRAGAGSRVGEALSLKRIATFRVPLGLEPAEVIVDSKANEIYVADLKLGKVLHASLTQSDSGKWVNIDFTGCSGYGAPIDELHLMRMQPYLLVLVCNRILLLDRRSLSLRSVVASGGDQFYFHEFDVSPDEHFIAVTGYEKTKPGTPTVTKSRVYRLEGESATMLYEASFGDTDAYYTPDGKMLATTYDRGSTPGANEDCGLEFYDTVTGKRIGGWRSTAKSTGGAICPGRPLQFLGQGSDRLITDDVVSPALSVWDVYIGKLLQHLSSKMEHPGPAPTTESLSISADGRLVAVVRFQGEWGAEYGMTIWDLSTGRALKEIPVGLHRQIILGTYFSSSGDQVAFTFMDHVDVYEYSLMAHD
jgi:hypothetical protein